MSIQDPSREYMVEARQPVQEARPWNHQDMMSRVRKWGQWANKISDEDFPLVQELNLIQTQLDSTLSEMQRRQLLALCLELNEGGSLEESQNWKDLRLTKEQVEGMAQIGAELRKFLDR